jgi:hypothetical protein
MAKKQRTILEIVTEKLNEQPVGEVISRQLLISWVTDELGVKFSKATVDNIRVLLTRLGYLEQPNTPEYRGYYVKCEEIPPISYKELRRNYDKIMEGYTFKAERK